MECAAAADEAACSKLETDRACGQAWTSAKCMRVCGLCNANAALNFLLTPLGWLTMGLVGFILLLLGCIGLLCGFRRWRRRARRSGGSQNVPYAVAVAVAMPVAAIPTGVAPTPTSGDANGGGHGLGAEKTPTRRWYPFPFRQPAEEAGGRSRTFPTDDNDSKIRSSTSTAGGGGGSGAGVPVAAAMTATVGLAGRAVPVRLEPETSFV